jgi:A/G-specific adenine glycosylase
VHRLAPSLPVLHERVNRWYAANARPLPWRLPGTSPWAVLVSEVMSHQTPVARVEPVWRAWLSRWPTPADLAAESPGEAVRGWGRLGYPRRALRLHAAARAIVERHAGEVPATEEGLRALPGIGAYTAAAVACFAFRQPTVVVDTNVRRVLVRTLLGEAHAAPTITSAERDVALAALPSAPEEAVTWNVAAMELGALVCTARSPRCDTCPVADLCAWNRAGRPAYAGPARRGQAWQGTDRQARGALLGVLRTAPGPVDSTDLERAWPAEQQRIRCLDSLVADGLVEPLAGDRYRLPA